MKKKTVSLLCCMHSIFSIYSLSCVLNSTIYHKKKLLYLQRHGVCFYVGVFMYVICSLRSTSKNQNTRLEHVITSKKINVWKSFFVILTGEIYCFICKKR